VKKDNPNIKTTFYKYLHFSIANTQFQFDNGTLFNSYTL